MKNEYEKPTCEVVSFEILEPIMDENDELPPGMGGSENVDDGSDW